jgi:hypothetical protein
MRKRLSILLLMSFLCTVTLQAYAQGSAVHCALMQSDMAAMSTAADDVGNHPSCADMQQCQLGTCMQWSILLPISIHVPASGTLSPPLSAMALVPERALPPLHRPPISY